MAVRNDITGKRFSRLTVLRDAGVKNHKRYYECRCDCGSVKTIQGGNITQGKSRSCGCLMIEVNTAKGITHGMTNSATYRGWAAMVTRCTNPESKSYKEYGGRGISICERWLKFANFLA